ncbi:MAG TPA: hypothetical protein VJH71_00635, partial [Candidatus Paceibacterota bacterium]
MQETTGLQLAQISSEVGVPRQRQRRRGTPKSSDATATAVVRKPRRKYHHVVLGGELEVSVGYLERWQPVERADRYGNVERFRERLRDEDGFTSSHWVEVERRTVDSSANIRFAVDEFPLLPTSVWLGRDGRPRWTLPGPTGPATPNPIEWVRPV